MDPLATRPCKFSSKVSCVSLVTYKKEKLLSPFLFYAQFSEPLLRTAQPCPHCWRITFLKVIYDLCGKILTGKSVCVYILFILLFSSFVPDVTLPLPSTDLCFPFLLVFAGQRIRPFRVWLWFKAKIVLIYIFFLSALMRSSLSLPILVQSTLARACLVKSWLFFSYSLYFHWLFIILSKLWCCVYKLCLVTEESPSLFYFGQGRFRVSLISWCNQISSDDCQISHLYIKDHVIL